MRRLDQSQLIGLYKQRMESGELFTPQLVAPSDIINYFIYVGNQIAQENKLIGQKKQVVIRYAVRTLDPVDTFDETEAAIKKHQQVFRTTLSRVRADFRKQGKLLIEFKALVHAAFKLENSQDILVFAWEFLLKEDVNETLQHFGDDTLVLGKD